MSGHNEQSESTPPSAPQNPIKDPPKSTPFCGACGYDLSGLGALTVCPECGTPGPPIELVDPGQQHRSHARFGRALLIICAVYAALFVLCAPLVTKLPSGTAIFAGPLAAVVVLLPYILAALVLGTLGRPRPGIAKSLQLGLATTVMAHIVLLIPLFASVLIGYVLMVAFSWLFMVISLVAARETRSLP